MKKISLILGIILGLSFIILPQQMGDKMMRQKNKLRQLEKIKLIDELNLDENTSIKFFARRNEMQQQIEALEDKSDQIVDKLDDGIKSGKMDESGQKQLIKELLNTKSKIEAERRQFIESLHDILPTEKIVRYIVFEQRFREEIRKFILDRRNPPR